MNLHSKKNYGSLKVLYMQFRVLFSRPFVFQKLSKHFITGFLEFSDPTTDFQHTLKR